MVSRTYSRGFTLVEIAVSLVIIALLVSVGTAALRLQVRRSELDNTKTAFETARFALIGFASAYGRIPCPDVDGDGYEDIVTDATTKTCTSRRGSVPHADLGTIRIEDGWNQRVHFIVNAELAKQSLKDGVWTPTLTTDEPNDGIVLSEPSSDCTSTSTSVVTQKATAFVLWSSGEDRIDASSDETGNRVILPSATCQIDDFVTWTSRFVLLGNMLAAGWVPPQ